VLGLFWWDAMDSMVELQFDRIERGDAFVALTDPRPSRAVREMTRLPGVLAAEGQRIVPVRIRAAQRSRLLALTGLSAGAELRVPRDADLRSVPIPQEGLALSRRLAERLGVRAGDTVQVEVLEGARRVHDLPVAALVEDIIGFTALIEIGALNRLMREPPSVTSVHLGVDPAQRAALFRALKQVPQVSSVTLRDAAVRTFHETMARTLLIYVSFFVVFACALAFGVTYNAARIALSERSRELATLRVLGFTRAEISYILVGETALLTVLALPLGVASGFGLAMLIVRGFETELFRVPFVIAPSTFGWAIVVATLATAASVLLVRRHLDRLDLIAVLKTRE